MTGRPFLLVVLAVVVVGCANGKGPAPIARNDLPGIFNVRPAVPAGFRRSAGYCAGYDDIAGFAQVSCSWRRRNLVFSTTMIADDERDFDPEDVEAHAEAIDAVARTR